MKKELISVLNSINKKFGENAVTVGAGDTLEVKRIPTGSISLDIALGGGIPMGRYTQINGAYSSSKTKRANDLGIPIVLVQEFRDNISRYL